MELFIAKSEIFAGTCGFSTTVQATKNEDGSIHLAIESQCSAITKMAAELGDVDAMQHLSARRQVPPVLQAGMKFCTHAACPVPVGIIKVIEVEAGLNLPVDVFIKVSK
jgi:hypothetical protein